MSFELSYIYIHPHIYIYMTSSLRADYNGLLNLLLGRVGLSLSRSLSLQRGFGMGSISLPWQAQNVELKICICACRAVIIKYLAKIRKRKEITYWTTVVTVASSQ